MHGDPPDFMALVTIFILSAAGAGYSLSESTVDRTRLQAAGYVAFRVALAFFFSVTISRWVQHYLDWASPIYTLVPIAFCIGMVDTLIRLAKPYWERFVDKFLPENKP
jgi:hypothetical protein